MTHWKPTLGLVLPLVAASAAPAGAQCLTGSCPTGTTIQTSDAFVSQLTGSVPFRQMTLSVDQFDPAVYAAEHQVPPTGISLIGVQAEFFGEIVPLVQLDSGGSPQACTADWHYDVESVIFTNADIGNPGILVIMCTGGTANLPASNGGPPPWDVSLTPPAVQDSFCFADTTGLAAWIGSGQVEFSTDGLEFSSASGCSGEVQSSFTNTGVLQVTVTYTYCVDGDPPPADVGTPYCFCDGSGTAAPCGNEGAADAGCANSTGFGAVIAGTGSNDVSLDNLVFQGTHLLPSQPALLFAGENAVAGGNGTVFGDGLRCAGGDVRRLGVKIPNASGNATWGPGLGAAGAWVAGDTRRFQSWYRNPTGSPCGAGFNLSNGYAVTFVP